MRVLALLKYADLAASTRQRFIQYEPHLAAAGITVDYAPLLGNAHLKRIVDGRPASAPSVGAAYVQRIARLLRAKRYDVLWVHCELFPYLPAAFERLAFLAGRPILFDFDDAIHEMYDSAASPLVRRLLGGKLEPLLRGAAACACGNAHLQEYAVRFCERTIVLPTIVDTEIYRPGPGRKVGEEGAVTIGWIGSPSTYRYVSPLLPLLERLSKTHGVRARIVGAGAAAAADSFAGLDLVEWAEEREVADVQAMDIGVMPLPDEPWARGKSGFKLIQYMACGLPVIASPVGVNSTIVAPGVNGFLANSAEEWQSALTMLIEQPQLRRTMGEAGRERAVAEFSLASQAPRLVALFQEVAATAGRERRQRL